MRTKHTPGPWAIGGTEHSKCRIYSHAESHAIARTYGTYLDGVPTAELTGPKNEADARLIAAAPDLLHALEMVRDADNDCVRDGLQTIPPIARKTIDDAIAKATGESQ